MCLDVCLNKQLFWGLMHEACHSFDNFKKSTICPSVGLQLNPHEVRV
jgi:hypothetical protein